jgi:NAD(P)-dependent dehydrogenase (short-subunit alcohol dehydrogenase family)
LRSILITGCSSGIGYAAAKGLKARGWRVFATVRSDADRARLAGEGLEALTLDYDKPDSIAAALDEVLAATGGTLDALYNNGAFAQAGAIEDLSTDLLRAQFESNFFGWHDLTRRVIPVMRRQGHGRIVFCSSILGYMTIRFRGAYAATKYAIEALADTLRIELHNSGIRVVLIEPGPVESRIVENALNDIDSLLDVTGSAHHEKYKRQLAVRKDRRAPFQVSAEAVLIRLILALEAPNPRARYRVTFLAHAAWYAKRMLPVTAFDWILRKVP